MRRRRKVLTFSSSITCVCARICMLHFQHSLRLSHVDPLTSPNCRFWRWISTHSALYTTYHRYLMAGFLGASSILPSLNDTEARSNENRAMLKAAACNETFETSNRMLESDIAEAEKQVIFFHRFELSRIGHTDVSQKKILFTNEHIICCLNRMNNPPKPGSREFR